MKNNRPFTASHHMSSLMQKNYGIQPKKIPEIERALQNKPYIHKPKFEVMFTKDKDFNGVEMSPKF